ncbi:transglycosylase SLT domain-containing protein [Treponema sp. OMZ 840]|uniref:transglycosylase SLT domain-containing protein n=1 Tax=Treponema sp. OMZ 840 TaxID=244313 RepID=UPI003D8A0F85
MQSTKTGNSDLAKICAGPLAFILLFLSAALSVAFFLPQTIESAKTQKGIRTEKDWLENQTQTGALLLGKPIEYAVTPSNVHMEIHNKGLNSDSGLEMYRQLISRNAVISFYEEITGNRDVTLAILEYADIYNIPLPLAFSLAFNESRYKVRAVNGNRNASVDRGLFQLNSESFPGFTEEDFFNPYVSAKQGLAFLRYCLDIGGNEISALAMYNAGTHRVRNNGTPQMTLNHISNIVTYKRGLEDMFNVKVAAAFRNQENKALAFLGK